MLHLGFFGNIFTKRMVAPLAAMAISLIVLLPAVSGAFTSGEQHKGSSFTIGEISVMIGADNLHERGITGAGVTVAVIDSGVADVPGLDGPGKVVHGPDISFESPIPELNNRDSYGHGTVMASIIAGDDGADGGFKGIAPGAQLLSVKVADNTGAVDVSQIIAAIDWVVANKTANGMNVRVLNLAYANDGSQSSTIDPLAAAVERAWDAGIVVVASVGNDGHENDRVGNPALDPFVIAVAAHDETLNGHASFFSSLGSRLRAPDISAPGDRVLGLASPGSRLAQEYPSAVLDGRFMRGSGTSHATAITSGAVALLLEHRPALTADQVKALLVLSADDLGHPGVPVLHGKQMEMFLDAEVGASKIAQLLSAELGLVELLRAEVESISAESSDGDTEVLAAAQAQLAEAEVHLEERRTEIVAEFERRRSNAAHTIESHWTGSLLGPVPLKNDGGAGALDVARAARYDALDLRQPHSRSNGSGSLQASRGSAIVMAPDGTALDGEVDFTGATWSGGTWSGGTWSGGTWSGGTWSGGTWSGGTWSGGTWSGGTWSGATWSGGTWSGGTWSGATWTGGTWAGGTWSGGTWSGATWAGADWS